MVRRPEGNLCPVEALDQRLPPPATPSGGADLVVQPAGRRGPDRFRSCDGLFVRFARTPGASVPQVRLRLADARAINARLPPYAARLVPKDASANYYWSCFFRR